MCESSPTTRLYPQSLTKRGPSPRTLRFKSPRAPGKHGAPFQSRTSVAGRRDALPSEDGAHVTTQHTRPPKPAPPKPCSTELPGRWLEAIGYLHPRSPSTRSARTGQGPAHTGGGGVLFPRSPSCQTRAATSTRSTRSFPSQSPIRTQVFPRPFQTSSSPPYGATVTFTWILLLSGRLSLPMTTTASSWRKARSRCRLPTPVPRCDGVAPRPRGQPPARRPPALPTSAARTRRA